MEVRIRHYDEGKAVYFTECHFSELEELIGFVKSSGGVYVPERDVEPFHSYQIILDDKESYVEIIVGEEDDG